MKAALIFDERALLDDGAIVEMTIWQVPKPLPPSEHGFKYGLFYGYPGRRIIAYDNERGKGDHRHEEDCETPYVFATVEQLVADFLADVRKVRGAS